ncbi:hypothetical protein N0V86_009572 [Didymella sp. IMI 355093]|nr:hypothetical protein N0V86_009572 [Didymella sp. IMI 355093]
MFRGPFNDSSTDDESPPASRKHTTPHDASFAQSKPKPKPKPSDQTAPTPTSTAPIRPPLPPARSTARPPLHLTSQTMTPADIATAQAATEAAQTRSYELSRAAHRVPLLCPIQLNGFQSSNTTPVALSTSDPRTIARRVLLPSSLPVMGGERVERLLAPVEKELERLRGTRVPPNNGRVKGKSGMQVVKERIVPVGRYLVQRLANMDHSERGATETDVCRYIAEHYWPQHLVQADGPRVMEMYRNAIYLERVEYEHRLAEEEEEATRLEASEEGSVDEMEQEMSPLIGQDMWTPQVGEELWRHVPNKEEMPELEFAPGTMVTLVDLLSSTYAPVQAMIISYIRVRDTIALLGTCKELRIHMPAFLSATGYNINYRLKRFFADPKQFRSVQGAVRALIFGDFARIFLAGTARKTYEMKIAVETGWGYLLHDYLGNEGYVLKFRPYEKHDAAGRTLKVSLAERDNASIAIVLADALNTSDLDIISWAKAYSLFGCATHVERKDRPSAYTGSLNNLDRESLAELEFDVPSSCSFRDLDVIEYLAEAWKDQLEYDEQQEIQRKKGRLDEVAKICVGK